MRFVDLETLPVAFDLPLQDDLKTVADVEQAFRKTEVGTILWERRDKKITADVTKLWKDLYTVWTDTAKDPWLCRPLCMGIAGPAGPVEVVWSANPVDDPTAILDAAWERQDGHWCSHGDFDRHVLTVAALKRKHPLLAVLPGGPGDRWASKWIDTMAGLPDRFTSLSTIARVLGRAKTAKGSDVLGMYLGGRFDELAYYCGEDVSILREYAQLRGIGTPETSRHIDDLFLLLARRFGLANAIARLLAEPNPPSREDVAIQLRKLRGKD